MVLAGDLDRGVPGLTDDAAVADAVLGAALELARAVGGVGRVLLFHPPEAEGRLTSRSLGFRLWPADGATAGQRFANAFRQAGDLGYEGALVLGLEAASAPPERVAEAAALLDQHQGVLAPDGRGGIALLGLQRAEPTLFPNGEDVPDVETIRTRARQQLVRLHEVPPIETLSAATVGDFLAARHA
jgi:glycosyltransferase A (GT-A) superfamily protein (DUF2064 family)